MITYNILADCYANTDFALTNLFAYCPKQYIDMDYRITANTEGNSWLSW